METSAKLLDLEQEIDLAKRLSSIPSVAQFDEPGEPEGWAIAHALHDLEGSFRTILDELIPKLVDKSAEPDALNDTLLDVGEEFRHILYHIRALRYYRYLIDDNSDP
jgi:hypothetical protein